MDLRAAAGEGIAAALLLGLIMRRRPSLRSLFFFLVLIGLIAAVVLHYGGQEDSSLFFWHPYIVLLIISAGDLGIYRRGIGISREMLFEKLLLWPFLVIPISSAFIMAIGWLIKLYRRNPLELFMS